MLCSCFVPIPFRLTRLSSLQTPAWLSEKTRGQQSTGNFWKYLNRKWLKLFPNVFELQTSIRLSVMKIFAFFAHYKTDLRILKDKILVSIAKRQKINLIYQIENNPGVVHWAPWKRMFEFKISHDYSHVLTACTLLSRTFLQFPSFLWSGKCNHFLKCISWTSQL